MIIGMVRYSVINNLLMQVINRDVFAEPYFTMRFNIFRNITLPCFARQTDRNFCLLVYHSDTMPPDKRALFADVAREFPFVRNIFVDGTRMPIPPDLMQPRMMTFRIDNDDAMPADFIERLRHVYEKTNSYNFVVSIPKMRKVARIGPDLYQTVGCEYISNSMGLAYCSNDGRSIMNLGDHRVMPFNTPMLIVRGMGGLQIINGTNISNGFDKVYANQTPILTIPQNEMADILANDGFGAINLNEILPITDVNVKNKI